ncbi:MAG: S8/S53 family peptidase [Deltaproteobacteria bacterium]|nr:S8/S53 family peptidase [Deltaproteobacteria bacterium]
MKWQNQQRQRAIALGTFLWTLGILLGTAQEARAQNTSQGETPWRWIGIQSEANQRCPPAKPDSGWSVEPLFANTNNKELKRFCLYQRKTPGNASGLPTNRLQYLDPDIMGVAAQGSSLAQQTWQALEEHFLSQVGQMSLPGAAASNVRLAILDSSPTHTARGAQGPEDAPANSPHGTALLNMARDLLCDPSETTCRALLASRLALAYTCFDPQDPLICRDDVKGGFIGLISELAQAIHQESSLPGQDRLVLNLSLGWQPRLGGTERKIADMPTPVQAVYRALEDASCRGGLVIAAAGNRSSGASSQPGPLLPALWETRRAPRGTQCQRLGLPATPGGAASYRPLLYSVAAVKDSAAALDTTRQRGVPRLAAFGDHAAVALSQSPGATATLTGSSVASLVVSATAAAVWSYLPASNPFQVMETVYQAGISTGRQADYCAGSRTCPKKRGEVREVSLCTAVAAACGTSPQCAPISCPTPQPLDLSAVAWGRFSAPTIDISTLETKLEPKPPCGNETVFYDGKGAAPAEPCPHYRYPSAALEPWIEPQPEFIPCPNCIATFDSPGSLYFEVDDLWKGDLTSSTLKCGTSSYSLETGTLKPGSKLVLTSVPESCLTASPTLLSFLDSNQKAVVVPICLCQGCT